MKIEDIGLWEAFLGVARQGNFSKAAVNLRIPLAQVSKRVAKLESQLNVRLFQRTTRVVSLTDEGKSLLPKIISILEDLHDAESSFEKTDAVSGTIKLTSAPFVASRLVLPWLAEFRKRYPNVLLEFELSERRVNLIDEGFDIAFRIETPRSSDFIYRKLARNTLIFCASPHYLKANSVPKHPNELLDHSLLMLSAHKDVKFKNHTSRLRDFEKRKSIICESGSFLTELAVAGHGILVRSVWDAQPLIDEKKLVHVMKSYPLEDFGHIYAVVPTKRFLAPRVKVFWDFVIEKMVEEVLFDCL